MGRVFYVDLPGHLKLTLLALADHANDEGGGIFVGQARLARKVGASIRSVHANLCLLRDQGFIEQERRVGPNGVHRYRLILARLHDVDRKPTADRQMLPTGSPLPVESESTGSPASVDRKPTSTEPSVTIRKEQPSWSYEARDFVAFWEAYPRRDGRREKRAEAVAEWKRLRPDALLRATLLRAVGLYARGTEKPVDAVRFLKHRRWEDDLLPVVGGRRPLSPRPFSPAADIPDVKPARSAEALATVRDIAASLPWVK